MQFYFPGIFYDLLHVMFSSIKTPKNFIDSDCLISLLHILSFGRTKGILSFLLGLWKSEYFVFVTFRDNLLDINHWLISSVNIMGSNKFEAFCRSFTYIKNKRGPNIDPWGTPHTTSFKSVFFILLIWMYCFLFVK